MRKLYGPIYPRRVIEISGRSIPRIEMCVKVDDGNRDVESAQHRESDAVVSPQHNREGSLGTNLAYHFRNFSSVCAGTVGMTATSPTSTQCLPFRTVRSPSM